MTAALADVVQVRAMRLRHKANPLTYTVFGGTPLRMAGAMKDKELIRSLKDAPTR
jgi:hypothetical protein